MDGEGVERERGMSKEELDKEYSPSQWCVRLTPDTVVQDHCDKLKRGSDEARQKFKEGGSAACELGVSHSEGGKEEASVDIFWDERQQQQQQQKGEEGEGEQEEAAKVAPVVAYIHGGYWQALSLGSSSWFAPLWVRERGCVVCPVGYDLCPTVSMEVLLEQVRNGIALIARRFPGRKLFVVGHSAGGHLCGMVAVTDWSQYGLPATTVAGIAAVSGVFDLEQLQRTYVNDACKMTPESAAALSPVRHASRVPKDMRVIIAVGENESPAFHRMAREYNDSLVRAGVSQCTWMMLPKEDHFTAIERLDDASYPLTRAIWEMMA
eukprot:g2242.t1